MRLVLNIGGKYPEITGPHSDAFAMELLTTADHASFDELVLDFEGTKIVSTMAMGTICSVRQKLRAQNKDLRIVNASEKVSRFLDMCKMTEVLMPSDSNTEPESPAPAENTGNV